jgi:uncharacterized protein YndB with AHSA1/START domain
MLRGMDGAEPIVIAVDLPVPPGRAFEAFAARFSSWWPSVSHSLSRDAATSCRLEPAAGGPIGERDPAGAWHRWGTVEAFEPGRRLRFTWHPGREPASAQWVDVSFEPRPDGSRATLTHGGWEALGEIAPILRREYASGWRKVFGEDYAGFVRRLKD